MKKRKPVLLSLFTLFFALSFSHSAFAWLGGNASSVESDRAAMHGVKKLTSRNLFQMHEITSGSQRVREYLSNGGTVFAVTWKGIGSPNLSQIFGPYYQEYQDANAATPRPPGRAPKTIRSSNLVVHRFGHMRDVQGKAYIPALMPNGVTPNDVR